MSVSLYVSWTISDTVVAVVVVAARLCIRINVYLKLSFSFLTFRSIKFDNWTCVPFDIGWCLCLCCCYCCHSLVVRFRFLDICTSISLSLSSLCCYFSITISACVRSCILHFCPLICLHRILVNFLKIFLTFFLIFSFGLSLFICIRFSTNLGIQIKQSSHKLNELSVFPKNVLIIRQNII